MQFARTHATTTPILGVVVGTLLTGWVAANHPGAVAGAVFAAPVFYLLVWSLTRPLSQAVVIYLIVYASADTFKRIIAIFAEHLPFAQLIPFGITSFMIVTIGLRGLVGRARRGSLDGIDRAMLVYLVGSAVGVLAAGDLPPKAKIVALPLTIGPFIAFYAYREIAVSSAHRTRFLQMLTGIAVVAAVYGIAQSQLGPSWIDRAWAERSHAFSIQAKNVWHAMHTGDALRPYSFLSDHFAYGFLAVAGIVAAVASGWPANRPVRFLCVGVLLVALSLASTRAAWLSMVGIVLIGFALRCAPRLGHAFPAAVIAVYLVMTVGAGVVYERFFPVQSFSSDAMARAFSVGSLSDRRDGLKAMGKAIIEYPVVGNAGDTAGSSLLRAKFSGHFSNEALFYDAHNFFVDKIVRAGVPGFIGLMVFLFLLLGRASRIRGPSRWYTAAACGLLLSGAAAGDTMLAGFFVAWCGFVAGTPIEPEVRHA